MSTFLTYNITLPNLRYKNDSIIFVPNEPIKISIRKDIKYINELKLHDIEFFGKIHNTEKDIYINYEIIRQELKNGLKTKIGFNTDTPIDKNSIRLFARDIQSKLLNAQNINKKENNSDEDSFHEYTKKKCSYKKNDNNNEELW